MSSGSPSSAQVRGFLKRVARGAKKAFKPSDQAPTSHTSPPPQALSVNSPPQSAPSNDPLRAPPPQTVLPRLATDPGQPSSAALPQVNDASQSPNTELGLARAAKKAGADAWAALRITLQLLKKSSDIVPTLKSAVGEFLGAVDTFEASDPVVDVPTSDLFCSGPRWPPRIGRNMQSSPRTSEPRPENSQNTRVHTRLPRCRRL